MALAQVNLSGRVEFDEISAGPVSVPAVETEVFIVLNEGKARQAGFTLVVGGAGLAGLTIEACSTQGGQRNAILSGVTPGSPKVTTANLSLLTGGLIYVDLTGIAELVISAVANAGGATMELEACA